MRNFLSARREVTVSVWDVYQTNIHLENPSTKMPPKPGMKKVSAPESEAGTRSLLEGVSSIHSWIKVQTMIRPTRFKTGPGGRGAGEGEDWEEEEEEQDVALRLTSRDPCAPFAMIKWDHKAAAWVPLAFKETMITHLDLPSRIVFVESAEGVEQVQAHGFPPLVDEDEEDRQYRTDMVKMHTGKLEPKEKARVNAFSFQERATQTKKFDLHESDTQTDAPPVTKFSACVGQGTIHDFFNASEKGKRGEEEDRKPGQAPTLPGAEAQAEEEEVARRLLLSARIVERMVNLNTFHDIAKDFRFYEDPADEFKAPEGSLLPLWKFRYAEGEEEEEELEGAGRKPPLEITALSWSPCYSDLFAAGYGSFDFYSQAQVGHLALFSLKNPSWPEYLCQAPSGVVCLDIHPLDSHLVVVGLYDGNVAVYNVLSRSAGPCYLSAAGQGKHRDVVWKVKWAPDNLDGYQNFYSISGDGRVTNWIIVRTSLWWEDKMAIAFTQSLANFDRPACLYDGARALAFKPDDERLFLVGTEEGHIYLATTEYSSAHLAAYRSHVTPVNTITWNPFYPHVFLSCASEYCVLLWHMEHSQPVLRFDLGSYVGDVTWAPYSSTVFSAVSGDGRVTVFDLSIDKYTPVCRQLVVSASKATLNTVTFNCSEPILLVGDNKGTIHCLKLSPNLRRSLEEDSNAEEREEKDDRKAEVTKMRVLLSQVIPRGTGGQGQD